MRHLKALLGAWFIFISFVLFAKLWMIDSGDFSIPFHLVCAGALATMGYAWLLRRSPIFVILLSASYITAGYVLLHRIIGFSQSPMNILMIGTIAAYSLNPILIIGARISGRRTPWRFIQGAYWIATILALPILYMSLEKSQILNARDYFLSLVSPLALLGWIAGRMKNQQMALPIPQRPLKHFYFRRGRALLSRRARPLLVKIIRGWTFAIYGICLGLIALHYTGHVDLFAFVPFAIPGAVIGFRLGKRMRTVTISIIVLTIQLIQYMDYLFIPEILLTKPWPTRIPEADGPSRLFLFLNLISYSFGFLAEISFICALITLILSIIRRRPILGRPFRWCFTIGAFSVLATALPSGSMMIVIPAILHFFSLNWSQAIIFGVLVLPPALMALSLWLSRPKSDFSPVPPSLAADIKVS